MLHSLNTKINKDVKLWLFSSQHVEVPSRTDCVSIILMDYLNGVKRYITSEENVRNMGETITKSNSIINIIKFIDKMQ